MRPSFVGTESEEPMPSSCLMASLRLPLARSQSERMRQIASRSELATSPPLPSCAKTSRSRQETGSTVTFTCMLPKGVICRMRRQLMISGSLTGASSSWPCALVAVRRPVSVGLAGSELCGMCGTLPSEGLASALASSLPWLEFLSAIGCMSRQPSR